MTNAPSVPEIKAQELLDQYDCLLIDAYGVLIHRDGPIQHAAAFIDALNAQNKPYVILTNDASRSAQSASDNLKSKGFSIEPEHVITSGSLVVPYFQENNLQGAKCYVFGPQKSHELVTQAGGIVIDPKEDDEVDVVIAMDDAGFDFLTMIEDVLSAVFRRLDAGHKVQFLVPNPDLIYQKNEREVGLTAGSIALIIEEALHVRYYDEAPTFLKLGKPHHYIYEQALKKTKTRNMAMIGDQIRTDILGANKFGIASILVATGLTQLRSGHVPEEQRPDFLLHSLAL